ncbi:hypothetical protein [Chloroflexus sp.]|uniref:hypothetical protein n=1 Tax=Chloroflexus sp. TaxID=1904827 RepID=UPI003C7465DF
MAYLIVVVLFVNNAQAFGIGGVGILALLVFMRVFSDFIVGQVDRKIKMEKRAIGGAKAEEKVGELVDE